MFSDDIDKNGPPKKSVEPKDQPEGADQKKTPDEELEGVLMTLKRHNRPPSVAPGSFLMIEKDPTQNGSEGKDATSRRPTIAFYPEKGFNVVYIPDRRVLMAGKPIKPKDSKKEED
jgi:hypothetical protein